MTTSKHGLGNLSDVDPSKKLLTDSSSLVDLKAETHRKLQEARFNKNYGKKLENVVQKPSTKVWSKSNIGVQQRINRDREDLESSAATQDQVTSALKRKAEIYNQLKKGEHAEASDRFLVQFNHSEDSSDEDVPNDINYPAKHPDEEWVEYTDGFGRTRMCMKKDLKELKRQDKELEPIRKDREEAHGLAPDELSEDVRIKLSREKWEQQEQENLKRRDINFSHIDFDEAREKGTGFYKFSQDAIERAKQQDDLRNMTAETKVARTEAEVEKSKKEAEERKRLLKVKNRKRLRKGLPMVPEDDIVETESKATDLQETKEETAATIAQSIEDELKMMRKENEEKEREKARMKHVREWDVGKEGVVAKMGEKKIFNQKEWVKERRTDRQSEFAPPSQYDRETPKRDVKRPMPPVDQFNDFPSDSFQSYQGTKRFRNQHSFSDTNASAVLKDGQSSDPMKCLDRQARPEIGPVPRPTDNEPVQETGSSLSIEERLKLFRNAAETSCGDCSNEHHSESRKKAEIAPPASMDYYANVDSSKSRPKPYSFGRQAMQDSFKFGLTQTRGGLQGTQSDSE